VKIHSSIDTLNAANPIVTIGMFDGVHSGHIHLIKSLRALAVSEGGESVVVTFWPHPRIVLGKDDGALRLITTLEEKTILMAGLGIDHLVVLPFTRELAALSSASFVEKILVGAIGVRYLLMGYNHRFGSDQNSSFDFYVSLAGKYGFAISREQSVSVDGLHCSSSVIRSCLLRGDIVTGNKLLGYKYSLSGRVVGGNRLGRTLGFPTANVEVGDPHKLIPANGVYACSVHVEGRDYKGMLNIGFRPTIEKTKEKSSIEVHILDFDHDIYSEIITISFVKRIRDEHKFESLDALIRQLEHDREEVVKCLS